MKKLIGMAVIALVVCAAQAGEDTTGLGYIEVCKPTIFTNGVANFQPLTTDSVANAGIDIGSYKGNAKIIVTSSDNLSVNAITNMTLTLQHATASTGTYAAVSSSVVSAFTLASTGKVQTASVDLGALHRYVRLQGTLQGTNTAISKSVSLMIVAPRLSE